VRGLQETLQTIREGGEARLKAEKDAAVVSGLWGRPFEEGGSKIENVFYPATTSCLVVFRGPASQEWDCAAAVSRYSVKVPCTPAADARAIRPLLAKGDHVIFSCVLLRQPHAGSSGCPP